MSAEMRTYREYPHLYDTAYHRFMQSAETFAQMLKKSLAGGRVLELAAGTGTLTRLLTKRYEVTATDLHPGMLEEAGKKAAGASFKRMDMRKMRYAGRFDAVVCRQAITYLTEEGEMRSVFKRAHRALKGGGVFLFNAPDMRNTLKKRKSGEVDFFEAGGTPVMTASRWEIDAKTGGCVHKQLTAIFGGRTKAYIDQNTLRLRQAGEYASMLRAAGFRRIRILHPKEGTLYVMARKGVG